MTMEKRSQQATELITHLKVTAADLKKAREEKFERLYAAREAKLKEKFKEDFALLVAAVEKVVRNDYIYMGNKDVFYYPSIVAIIPDLRNFSYSTQYANQSWQFGNGWNNKFAGFTGTLSTLSELKRVYKKIPRTSSDNSSCGYPHDDCCGYTFSRRVNGFITYQKGYYGAFRICNGGTCMLPGDILCGGGCPHLVLPIFRLNGENSREISAAETVLLWAQHDLVPRGDWFTKERKVEQAYERLRKFCQENKDYLAATAEGIGLNKKALRQAIAKGENPDVLGFNAVRLFTSDEVEVDESYSEELRKRLLTCDEVRANMDPYDAKMLTDINRGHWDLWEYNEERADTPWAGEVKISGLVARNPYYDLQEGTVAIDFGTKSTVVVYGDGELNNKPLQIGNGKYAQQVDQNKYENPTVMRFIDVESFTAAYDAQEGRPATKWEDVTVSHTAFSDMLSSSEACYNNFVANLKQWACNKGEKLRIEDRNKWNKELPPFLSLTEDDVNPIEIYAYYIGCYLNNMLGKPRIYKHYIMSFPVTSDHEVREKILASFRRGLIKSLPRTLAEDETFLAEEFTVEEGATEPAAYAATALLDETSGALPEDDDDAIYYGVFDFGGGTADFDYGVLRYSDIERYNYDLVHFGANGDRSLGGENLLRLLAYEVLRVNRANLRWQDEAGKNYKIPFVKVPGGKSFIDETDYIEQSQAAQQNMHNLMEKLRPVWEAPESEEAQEILDSGAEGFKVKLFDTEGRQHTDLQLYLEKGETEGEGNANKVEEPLNLQELIWQRIEEGVVKFFISLREAFAQGAALDERVAPLGEMERIRIYLAGNSSKAKVVKDIFEAYLKNIFEAYLDPDATKTDLVVAGGACEILGLSAEEMPEFIIVPPLGLDSKDLSKPNGKTGVAFGLIKCREEGEDIRVIYITTDEDQIPFQYYLGRPRRGKFQVKLSPQTKLNTYVNFIDARNNFEFYYTNDPSALDTKRKIKDIAGLKMKTIRLSKEERDENKNIYIRAIDSTRISWCIAATADEAAEEEGKVIELRE